MASLFKKAFGNTLETAGEKIVKVGGANVAQEAAEKAAKEAAKKLAEKTAKTVGMTAVQEAAEKTAKEAAKQAAEKAAKEAAEKATKEATKEALEKAAKEATEKASKEATEKAAKTALPLSKNLKKGALGLAAVTAVGLGAAEGVSVYNRSKQSFDKRNQKQFVLTSISSSPDTMTITFVNTDNLKIYAEETIDIVNVDPMVNGTYEVLSQVDMTTITVKRDLTKPAVNLSAIKTGNMKLNADQKNDVTAAIEEDLKKVTDLGKSALCNTISFLKLDPYIDSVMNGSYIVFLIICIVVLMKIAEVLNMVLGKIPFVKMIVGLLMLGVIVAIHFLIGPYFVLTC